MFYVVARIKTTFVQLITSSYEISKCLESGKELEVYNRFVIPISKQWRLFLLQLFRSLSITSTSHIFSVKGGGGTHQICNLFLGKIDFRKRGGGIPNSTIKWLCFGPQTLFLALFSLDLAQFGLWWAFFWSILTLILCKNTILSPCRWNFSVVKVAGFP